MRPSIAREVDVVTGSGLHGHPIMGRESIGNG